MRFVLLLLLWSACHGEELAPLRAENNGLQSRVEELEGQLQAYNDALPDANVAVSVAAFDIGEARSVVYSDCGSLRARVVGMTEPNEVPAP